MKHKFDISSAPKKVNKMRIALYVTLLLATLGCMAALRTCGHADVPVITDAEGKDHGDTLIVSIIHSPMSYYIYDDTIGGLNYDMLRLLADDLNRPVRFVPVVSHDASLQSLVNGSSDLLASLPVTSELKDKFLFSESVFLDRQVLVQHKLPDGSIKVKSVLDLAGDTIHIEKNSPARERLANLAEEIGKPVVITSHSDMSDEYLFLKIVAGELRYAVINEKTAHRMAIAHPEISIDTPVGFTQFQCWVTRRSDAALLEKLDTWLAEFKKTNRYRELMGRYAPTDTISTSNI